MQSSPAETTGKLLTSLNPETEAFLPEIQRSQTPGAPLTPKVSALAFKAAS